MKYFVILIAVISLGSAVLLGYICFNNGFFTNTNLSKNQITSDELKDFNRHLSDLSNELVNLKEILNRQSLFIQKLKEDNIADSARIASLEKKMQLSENKLDFLNASNPVTTTVKSASSELLNHGSFTELFNNDEFAKIFHDKVGEIIKDIQQKEREAQMKVFSDQIQQMLTKRIDDFAKSQNLNDYQHQELNKIILERSTKTMELFSKIRSQEITSDEFRTQSESLRNESNEKVKQILLTQQYEEYQKIEEAMVRGNINITIPTQRNPPPR
jgi:hypothetical protein